jgi:hypothetical protein
MAGEEFTSSPVLKAHFWTPPPAAAWSVKTGFNRKVNTSVLTQITLFRIVTKMNLLKTVSEILSLSLILSNCGAPLLE